MRKLVLSSFIETIVLFRRDDIAKENVEVFFTLTPLVERVSKPLVIDEYFTYPLWSLVLIPYQYLRKSRMDQETLGWIEGQ